MLRFKAPALIEFTTEQEASTCIILTRDIKVVDAFACASHLRGVASFSVVISDESGNWTLIEATKLCPDMITRAGQFHGSRAYVKAGQKLTVEVHGHAQATVCLWVIPQPRM